MGVFDVLIGLVLLIFHVLVLYVILSDLKRMTGCT